MAAASIRNFSIVLIGIAMLAGWAGPAAAEPDLELGAELYDLCGQCHGPAGEGEAVFVEKLGAWGAAPAIAGFPEWYVVAQLQHFKNGARGVHPDDVGGLRMHPMSLSLKDDHQIESVAAHVAKLPSVPPEPTLEGGDPQQGAARYNALCSSCHGPGGAGNEQGKAPRLAGSSDWYLLAALQKYKAGVRGSNPTNPFGAVMRSFALQLDDQAMLDLVAYIGTLDGS